MDQLAPPIMKSLVNKTRSQESVTKEWCSWYCWWKESCTTWNVSINSKMTGSTPPLFVQQKFTRLQACFSCYLPEVFQESLVQTTTMMIWKTSGASTQIWCAKDDQLRETRRNRVLKRFVYQWSKDFDTFLGFPNSFGGYQSTVPFLNIFLHQRYVPESNLLVLGMVIPLQIENPSIWSVYRLKKN